MDLITVISKLLNPIIGGNNDDSNNEILSIEDEYEESHQIIKYCKNKIGCHTIIVTEDIIHYYN